MSTISHVEIVVPARNERHHLAECLCSLRRAVEQVGTEQPMVTCGITIVLDRCTDDSAEILQGKPIRLVSVDAGCVGTARRMGIADTFARTDRAGLEPHEVWIANTDADTIVPATWLTTQLRLATDGADAVLGTVTPFGVTAGQYRRWRQQYHLGEDHSHVHGANLGFRADTYLRAGGFRDIPTHEDVDLVERIRHVSPRWIATHRTNVRTSGRQESFVDGGFATYVAALEA